jgi:hypothetical protein
MQMSKLVHFLEDTFVDDLTTSMATVPPLHIPWSLDGSVADIHWFLRLFWASAISKNFE